MIIESLEDLRPGDLMLCGQSAAPAKLLVYIGQLFMGQQFRIGKFAAGHAAVVVPGGRIVEAMPHGARVRDLRPSDWSPDHVYIRLPEDYPGQALDAAAAALAMVGITYSIVSYVYIGTFLAGFKFDRLAKRIDRRHPVLVNFPVRGSSIIRIPDEAICSVLAEQAWTLTGYSVIHGTRPQVVTPGMLGIQLWTREGVIRGGAGLL
jgi:hypothetical protein